MRHHRARRLQEAAVAFGIWAVFAILSIWAPLEVLILAVAAVAFVAGATLGVRGVAASTMAIIALSVFAELSSTHPLSTHTFLRSGVFAVCLVVVCGLAGHALRVVVHRMGKNARQGLQ